MVWFFGSKANKNDDNAVNEEAEDNRESVEILDKMLSLMDFKVSVEQGVDDADNIVLNISTDEPGRVIGDKGETLYSLQYLLNKIIYSKNTESPKVIVDVDSYRSKRKEKLIVMAQETAQSVKKSGKTSSLPPLNSYERKVIHESLHDDDEVVTQSQGEGYYKRVLISLKNK